MAIIANKSTSVGTLKCLVLNGGEALYYPFNTNEDWNRIRVGMMLAWTNTTSVEANMDGFGGVTINPASNESQRIYYGVQRDGPHWGRETNGYFIGYRSEGSYTSVDFPQVFASHRNDHGQYNLLGIQHPNGGFEGSTSDFNLVSPGSSNNQTSGYGALFVIFMEIVNKGQPNQKVIVRTGIENITDTTYSNFRTSMRNIALTTVGTLNFNLSGTPYKLPNNVFIHNPLTQVRMRVHAVGVMVEG